MKTNKWIAFLMMGMLLVSTPSWAQRRGSSGSRPSGGVSHSSRGFSSSSRGSSASSRSFSMPTRSTSSSRGYNMPSSRPSSRSYSTSERSSSTVAPRAEATSPRTPSTTVRGSAPVARPTTVPSHSTTVRPSAPGVRTSGVGAPHTGGAKGPVSGVRPGSYAHPLHPAGPMPPSHRHLRPAPYFYHPIHHHCIHMHPVYWDPFLPSVIYWPGLWSFCVGYWAGSSCSNYSAVHDYVSCTHHVDMVAYAISGDLMYALVKDDGDTYLRVFDKADNLLAQHPVHRKYTTLTIDPENGGCWIMKKNDKDPLLFLYADGQLLIYEAD